MQTSIESWRRSSRTTSCSISEGGRGRSTAPTGSSTPSRSTHEAITARTVRPKGGDREYFTKDTWVVRDICEHTPYPFADKQFDYVTCSHVLEDVRDPLWVCSEMRRIAKRGYIEMPSREAESCRGTEPNQVGWSHHRWLVTIDRTRITFLLKYHRIHAHWRLSFPASHLRSLSEERQVQWLFWDDRFDFEEQTIHGVDNIEAQLAAYVQSVRPYQPGCRGHRPRDTPRDIPGRASRPVGQASIGDDRAAAGDVGPFVRTRFRLP